MGIGSLFICDRYQIFHQSFFLAYRLLSVGKHLALATSHQLLVGICLPVPITPYPLPIIRCSMPLVVGRGNSNAL